MSGYASDCCIFFALGEKYHCEVEQKLHFVWLLGSEALIRKYRPKLAVCIYHKPEDVIDIPKFILDCYSGYKFYVRHYALAEYETVLYAVP